MAEERQRLKGLAETHFVAENTARSERISAVGLMFVLSVVRMACLTAAEAS
jgi:hypothetical protein